MEVKLIMKRNRKIDRKIKKKRVGLILVILSLTLTFFFLLLTKTSLFTLSYIKINGNEKLSGEKVEIASGLQIGENIFKIDVDKVKKNLLSHPYIKEVVVRRIFPNKMEITIEERKETIVISYIGSFIYLDEEGIVLNVLADRNSNIVPEIRGLDIKDFKLGKKIVVEDKEKLDEATKFTKYCKEEKIFDKIEIIDINDEFSFFLTLRGGTKVAFGDLNNVKYKLRFALTILEDLKNKNQVKGTINFTKGQNPIFIPDSI